MSASVAVFSMYVGDDKFPKNPDGTIRYDYTPIMDTWVALEKMVDEGLVRHIGLSNFNSAQVDEVCVAQTKGTVQPITTLCNFRSWPRAASSLLCCSVNAILI